MSVDTVSRALVSNPQVLGRAQDLFRGVVRDLRGHLINRLGCDVPVRFSDAGYVGHGELIDDLAEEGAGVFVRFHLEPCGVPGLLAVDGLLLYRLMGLLLGEDPHAEPGAYVWRPPTRMDRAVAERLASDLFLALCQNLPPEVAEQVRILEVTGSPRIELPIPRNAPLLDITLDFGPAEDPYGLVTLALPLKLAELIWPEATQRNEATERGVSRVLPLPVTVVAELGRVKMSLSDLTDLAEGSILRLGAPQAVELSVSGRPTLSAEAGEQQGTRCVRVLRRVGPSA